MNTWAQEVAKNVGEGIREARGRLGMTANQLAEEVTAAGVDMTRAVITALETGRRSTVSVPELLVLGWVLKVPPVALLYPHMPDKEVEAVPGEKMTELDAALWVAGELPQGGSAMWTHHYSDQNAPMYTLPLERSFAREEDHRMRWDYLDYFRKWQALINVDHEEEPEEYISAFAEMLMKHSELHAAGRPVRSPLEYLPSAGKESEDSGEKLLASMRNLAPDVRQQLAELLSGES